MLKAGCFSLSLLLSACTAVTLDPAPVADEQRHAKSGMLYKFWFSTFSSTSPDKSRGGQNTQAASMVGREDLIVTEKGESVGRALCATRSGDPIAEIVRLAQATNIVIINEAHDSPRDRHFIAAVLRALKPLGYDVYAAETFNNGADIDHPLVYLDDGFYSTEPMFGRLLTEAKQLGYRFVAYEMTDAQGTMTELNALPFEERIERREIAQTANLMTALFRDNPNTKVIIHVGHSHVKERAQPGKPEWMAQRLATASGKDPLTISQTECYSSSGSTSLAVSPDDVVDLYVAHGPLILKGGRPAWRQDVGDTAKPVPDSLLPTDAAVIVEARPLSSPIDTVPIDRLLLRPGEHLPLLLPPGSYRLDAKTATDTAAPGPVELTVRGK